MLHPLYPGGKGGGAQGPHGGNGLAVATQGRQLTGTRRRGPVTCRCLVVVGGGVVVVILLLVVVVVVYSCITYYFLFLDFGFVFDFFVDVSKV